jgi:iron complex outermembrane receptor protein
MDSVVVTATRFPEEVRRLPASVTVVTAMDIQKSAARTLPELLAEQVGFTMKDLFGNNASSTSVDLRGFGVTGSQNTLILVDGRRVSDIDFSSVQWAAIPLSAIDRIEILRGTGAVLYGDGTTQGVVNIVLRSPLNQGTRAELAARAASYETFEGRLFGSYSRGRVGAMASLHTYQSDGYRVNNRNEQGNASLNARWQKSATTWLDVRGGVDRQDLRLPGARNIQPSTDLDEYAGDRRGAQTPLDWSERDGDRAGVTFATMLDRIEFNIGADWRTKNQRAYFDQGGFPTYRDDDLDLTSITPRVRIPVSFGGMAHRITFGGDVHQWRYESHRSTRPDNIDRPINIVSVDEDMFGLYVQDLVQLGGKTLLSLGGRFDRVKFDGRDVLDPTAPGADFASEAAPARRTQKEHALEIGLRRSLSESVALFVRSQRSFRFVNAEEIYESNASFAQEFQILAPQTAVTVEGGAEWMGASGGLRATVFQTDVDDEIHLDAFTTGVGNTNLPPSRRRGIELDGYWQPTSAVSLHANYAWTKAEFLEGVLPGGEFAIAENIDIAGKSVPIVPENKLNVGITWKLPASFMLSALASSVSKQFMDNDEPNSLGVFIPAYSLVDVKVSREFSRMRLHIAVNNLFDEDYFTYGVRSQFTADRYAVYPLPPRTLSVGGEIILR